MLSFLPDSLLQYVVHIILVVGGVSFFISFFILHRILNRIPSLAPYTLLIQIVSTVLLVSGIYFEGGYNTEMEWRAKVKEAEDKVAKAEEASRDLNKKLEEEKKKKQKVRVEYYNTVKERIKEVEKIIDKECKLDPKVNEIINDAAKNPEAKK